MQTIKELALKTKAELERRGPVTTMLGETQVFNPDSEVNDNIPEFTDVPPEECRVCLLGAAGAAYAGDPFFADRIDDISDEGDFTAFCRALVSEIGLDEGNPATWDLSAVGTITSFFDSYAGVVNGDVDSLGKVYEVLDRVASKYDGKESA